MYVHVDVAEDVYLDMKIPFKIWFWRLLESLDSVREKVAGPGGGGLLISEKQKPKLITCVPGIRATSCANTFAPVELGHTCLE